MLNVIYLYSYFNLAKCYVSRKETFMSDERNAEHLRCSEEDDDIMYVVRKMVEEFLEPEIDKLKSLFPNYSSPQITVFSRSASFTTSPMTSVRPIPIGYPEENASEFWMKVVEYAKTQGLEADNFPKKVTSYLFGFVKRYN